MPSLLSTTELAALQRRTAGVTRERMLRELAEALEVITAEHPLVLVLEDLHWSDVSTLDLLSMLARRQERARLLILGTYRPVEVLTRDHPLKGLKQELQLHGQCEELALNFLSEAHVEEYLARRTETEIETERKQDRVFTATRGSQEATGVRQLARLIHRRTDGNPLFMVNVVDHLLSQGVLQQRDGQWLVKNDEFTATVPENLRQLIAQQLTRVTSDEHKVLEAASVAGAEFSAAAVAAGVEQSTEAVETHCDNLVHREQFLRSQGTSEWPDGTVAARYGFAHALYQEVLYPQLSATRRIRLHRQIGEREEQGYGERAREIAAELAMHFERGRDYRKAVRYVGYAGENATRRSAYQESVILFTKGLELLKALPVTPERAQQELRLQVALGTALTSTKGYAAPEVKQTYLRAQELSQQLGKATELFSALSGLRCYYAMRTEHKTANALADQLLKIAEDARDSDLLIEAHVAKSTVIWMGEFLTARRHFERGLALYDPQQHRSHAFLYGQDPAIACLSQLAQVLWLLGYPDQARHRGHQAINLAQELSHPNSLGYALDCTAMCHQLRREPRETQELAEATVRLGIEHGFPYWETQGTMLLGSALAEQGRIAEGLTQMTQGFAAHQAIGGRILEQYWLALQVEAYQQIGQVEEAVTVLTQALAVAEKNGERFWEAELYRLKGELTLQKLSVVSSQFSVTDPRPLAPDPQDEAEECFLKAIDIARKQQAKSLELRATMSLVRLRQQHAAQSGSRNTHHATRTRLDEAHQMLSEVYHWFTEGFDTKDLQEAKALLNSLESRV
jgi:predicted ATPase/3-dehydroquinate dehydratase